MVLRMRFRTTYLLTAVACLALIVPAIAEAQSESESSSREARDRLYDEVAKEVAALQRYSSLLKKVVQLIKPTGEKVPKLG